MEGSSLREHRVLRTSRVWSPEMIEEIVPVRSSKSARNAR